MAYQRAVRTYVTTLTYKISWECRINLLAHDITYQPRKLILRFI